MQRDYGGDIKIKRSAIYCHRLTWRTKLSHRRQASVLEGRPLERTAPARFLAAGLKSSSCHPRPYQHLSVPPVPFLAQRSFPLCRLVCSLTHLRSFLHAATSTAADCCRHLARSLALRCPFGGSWNETAYDGTYYVPFFVDERPRRLEGLGDTHYRSDKSYLCAWLASAPTLPIQRHQQEA